MLRGRLIVVIRDSHIKSGLMELSQNDDYKDSIALQTSGGLEATSNYYPEVERDQPTTGNVNIIKKKYSKFKDSK